MSQGLKDEMRNKTYANDGGRRLWGAGSVATAWSQRLDHVADRAAVPLVRQALVSAWRAQRPGWFAPLSAPRLADR